VWTVRATTIELLRALSRGEGAPAGAGVQAVDGATRLLAHYFREVFGVDPPTFGRLLGEGGARRAGP
jgi:hypothetical protein